MGCHRYVQSAFKTLLLKTVVWESLEHRLATAANKEIFTKIMEALSKASTKIEYIHDVAFSVDLSSALASPVTEIVSVELKPTTDIHEFQKHRAALEDKIRELSPPVWHGGAWGTVANNDRQFGACFGWDSPEVCPRCYCSWFNSDIRIGIPCFHSRYPRNISYNWPAGSARGRGSLPCEAHEVRKEVKNGESHIYDMYGIACN